MKGTRTIKGWFGLAWAAWAAAVFALSSGHLKSIAGFFYSLAGHRLTIPSSWEVLRAAAGHLGTLAFTAVFAWVCLRAGLRALRLFRLKGASRWEEMFIALGTGWGIIATACFGFCLAGLYMPGVLLALLLVAFAAGARVGRWKSGIRMSPGARTCCMTALLVGLPFILLFPLILVPSLHVDVYQYHMAAPEHFLRMHRFVLDGVNQSFSLFISAELLGAYELILGREGLTQLLFLIPYFAGLALGAEWVRKVAGPLAAGVAFGIAPTILMTTYSAVAGKNDLAEVGFCMLALVAMGRKRQFLAAVMWGLACGVKVNGFAFAGLAWLWHEGESAVRKGSKWRPDIRWLIPLTVLLAPWLAKAWLIKGDPLWPVLSNWFPGALWDGESGKALALIVGDRPGFLGALAALLRTLNDWQPAIIGMLPGIVFGFGALPLGMKKLVVFAGVAYAAYAFGLVLSTQRMALPLMTFISYAGTCSVFLLARRFKRFYVRVLVAGTILFSFLSAAGGVRESVSHFLDLRAAARYLLGSRSVSQYEREYFKSLAEVRDFSARIAGVKTTMLVSESRCYKWPGRTWSEEMWGRLPPWVMTKECDSVRRAIVWFRQRNITHVVYNFYSGGFVRPYEAAFVWDDRQVRLWRDFLGECSEVVHVSPQADHTNGGFYVYRVGGRFKTAGKRLIFALPGIKSVWYWIASPMVLEGDFAESRRRTLEYASRFPDVGEFRMEAGYISALMRDWEAAYAYYSPLVNAGMPGVDSLFHFGRSAVMTGRLEEGIGALEASKEILPDRSEEAELLIAQAYASRANGYVERGEGEKAWGPARKAFERAPADPWVGYVMARVLRGRGMFLEAEQILSRVLETDFGRRNEKRVREEIELCRSGGREARKAL